MITFHKIRIGIPLVIIMFFSLSPTASAWGRAGFSLGGPIGIRVHSNGKVGVSTPTPQVSVGTGGTSYNATVTADPRGVRTGVTGPYGVKGGVSSDGSFYGGAEQNLPGGVGVSGQVDQGGASGGVSVDPPIEPIYYDADSY